MPSGVNGVFMFVYYAGRGSSGEAGVVGRRSFSRDRDDDDDDVRDKDLRTTRESKHKHSKAVATHRYSSRPPCSSTACLLVSPRSCHPSAGNPRRRVPGPGLRESTKGSVIASHGTARLYREHGTGGHTAHRARTTLNGMHQHGTRTDSYRAPFIIGGVKRKEKFTFACARAARDCSDRKSVV